MKIAASVAADAFSRGSESPVTPFVPTVFYRAATEMLCENVAALVVDATAGRTPAAAPAANGDGLLERSSSSRSWAET